MDSDDIKYIKKQMADNERKMRYDLNDKYNTKDEPLNEDLYKQILHADLKITPKAGQLWKDYLIELKIHTENAHNKNWQIHVVKGVRGHPWYTHTSGLGCFMCEDTNMIYAMYTVMCLMAAQYPDQRF